MIQTYFNFKRYDIFDKNQNKKTTILNYGEAHGCSPYLDFENMFKNHKTGFFVENPISLLDTKYCNFWYFLDASTKEGIEHYKKSFNRDPCGGYDNLKRLAKYFKDYYKNYIFENPNDKKIMNEKREINKKFSYYPCDNRMGLYMGNILVRFQMFSGLIYKYFVYKYKLPISETTKYILDNSVNGNDSIKLNYDIYKSFEEFKGYFMRVYDKYYSFKKHEDVLKKIYKTMKKYINEDYEKLLTSTSNKTIAEYISKLDPHKLIIDIFNCYTFYQFEEELKQPIQKPIHLFIKKLYKEPSILKVIPDNSFLWVYDILLWINVNKHMWQNRYNVLYSGAHHSILFDEYIKVLVEFNGYENDF